MANLEHVKLIRHGTRAWNMWRWDHCDIRPDLSHSDLREVDLSGDEWGFGRINLWGTNLEGANLRGANLQQAILTRAMLASADLTSADLSEANLATADLSQATLIDSKLIGCDLLATNLTDARLNGADLQRANLQLTKCHGTDLSSSNLIYARFIATDLTDAVLDDSRVYGISAWDVRLESTRQCRLLVTPPDQPSVAVDDLQVAQFIYLLLNHKNLRNVVNAVTQRGVLILGRFGGGGVDLLRAAAEKLRSLKYLPMIFDFERPRDRNYTETIKTLAGLSRFVLVDLSGSSVPQELYATVPHFKIPFIPIMESGRTSPSMIVDLLEYEWVMKPVVEFRDIQELVDKIPLLVVAPAEKKVEQRQQLLRQLMGAAT